MNETKFTPGPWHVFYDEILDEYRCTIANKKSFLIANVSQVPIRRGETYKDKQMANAHLIAAAPEMYKVLEHCLDYITGGPFLTTQPTVEEIAGVLARARGEVRE